MYRLTIRLIVAVLTFIIGVGSTWIVLRFRPNADIKSQPLSQETKSLASPVEITSSLLPKSPIREVEFANFTYPRIAELIVPGKGKAFTLKDGKYEELDYEFGIRNGLTSIYLGDVVYGDVTGDGVEDAIVSLGLSTGGTAIPNVVYIYALSNNRLKLLWAFTTGDRADGGLRRIYPENGGLVIELYGKGTRIGGELYGTESAGACCAYSVTRTHYRWRGNKFRQEGESIIFPNPASNSSYIGNN